MDNFVNNITINNQLPYHLSYTKLLGAHREGGGVGDSKVIVALNGLVVSWVKKCTGRGGSLCTKSLDNHTTLNIVFIVTSKLDFAML